MSYLDKLSIQGIRSFDSESSQVVQFYPLTIILGPNGAGKTSIIESLKYVTTGLTPPNSNGGKTFIHDPILANKTSVKGQVKLRFSDIEKKMTTITRSVESISKKVKGKQQLSFKAINSVINRDNKSIDQRCNDINNEMLNLLGVSKAVISNVIFCHQEDCNWPLSDGKVLKEKFDDIFGSMGYVKALERIKKLRKTEFDDQKLLEKDVKFAKQMKLDSDSKKSKLNNNKSQLIDEKEKIANCETKLNIIRSELSDILAKEDSIQEITNKIATTEGTVKEKERMLIEIKDNIQTLFTGTEDELNLEIKNFETNAQNAKAQKNSLKIKECELSKKWSQMNELFQSLTKELTKLQFAEEQYKTLLSERTQLVAKIGSETSITINDNIISKTDSNQLLDSNDITQVLNLLNDELINLNKEMNEQKSVHNQSYELLSKELNDCKALKSNHEHEVQIRQKELTQKQMALNDIQRKIRNCGMSDSSTNSLNDNIKRLSDEIKQMESNDIESTKKDLNGLELEKKRLKSDIISLEDKLKKLHQQNEERIKLEILKKDKDEKENKAKLISELHKDIMESVSANEGEFHSSLNNHIRNLSAQLDKKVNNVSKIDNELSSKSARVEMKQESIRKKKQELNDLENEIKKFCNLDDYEKTLNSANTELKDLRIQFSHIGSYEPFLKKEIHCIEDNECCPVCERDMNCEWNAKNGNKLNKEQVLHKLERLVKQTPDSIEELKKNIAAKESHYQTLLSLRSKIQTINALNKELPKIQNEIMSNIEDNNNQRKILEKEKLEISKQKSELSSLRSVLQDASDYDNYFAEMKDLDYKINCVVWKCDNGSDSIEDINNDLQQKKSSYDEIDSQISKSQSIISKHTESYNKLQKELQRDERKILEIEREQQQKINNIKKKEEFENDIKVLDQNIIDSQLKAMELNPKIDEIDSQIKEISNELQEVKQKFQSKIQTIKDKQKDIERINRNIEVYERSGKSDKMIELNEKLTEVKKDVSEVNVERIALSKEIDEISDQISTFEVRKRELNDNLKIFKYESEIKEKTALLEVEREKLGFHDLQALKTKKRELEKEQKTLEGIKHQSKGKQLPIIQTITQLEDELKNPKYRNADNAYKQKLIELKISAISGEDLNKYYKALDYAVSAFHRRKMEEINKLIKGFWKNAYKGQDIDFIKITSDEEERSANDKRRNFNYRVVMVKENIEMDMKGRCSAGQKVLASLIIRLALAEIFCANCSVLALDEPTTNLDKDNISSFANAITEIVKYRKKWKNSNFQLIIITHDEEFLRCLDSETGQHYYKVFKNASGFSNILRKSIDDKYEDNAID